MAAASKAIACLAAHCQLITLPPHQTRLRTGLHMPSSIGLNVYHRLGFQRLQRPRDSAWMDLVGRRNVCGRRPGRTFSESAVKSAVSQEVGQLLVDGGIQCPFRRHLQFAR